jgi:prolyl-tRNA editing enzyme YbaK/EbsC (Cys-tRNA(Pro) deacylase)
MTDQTEQRVLTALDALDATYTVVRIDPDYAVTADFCERYGYGMDESANCIVVASKTGERRHVACLVQATRRLDVNGVVRRRMGVRKVSFAPADETVEVSGMLPNGVTPFGLPADLPLWVDAGVMAHERVIVGGGSLSLKLLVDSEVFTRMPHCEIVDDLAKPSPEGPG